MIRGGVRGKEEGRKKENMMAEEETGRRGRKRVREVMGEKRMGRERKSGIVQFCQ